ncbi:unknown [Acidaminococcus sp. CAG:917]|nr:unknown [Acidaminococcus sp. CAG:917]
MAKKSSKISVVSIVMVALVAVFLVLGIAGVCVDEYLVGVQEKLDVREPAGSFQDYTDLSNDYQELKADLSGEEIKVEYEYAEKLSAAVAFGYLAIILSAVCLVMVILSLFFQGGLWGLLTLIAGIATVVIAIIMISTTSAYCADASGLTGGLYEIKMGTGAILLAVGSIGAGAATVVKKFVK